MPTALQRRKRLPITLCGALLLWPVTAAAKQVDLELLLAVDVSPSVSHAEYTLQMDGLAAAFRHPAVIGTIRAAAPNGVAVGLMQWAGPDDQSLSVAWTEVHDEVSAAAFAARIEAVSRLPTGGGTAIGDALDRGIALLTGNGFDGARQVIDVSGDGRTNRGASPAPVRTSAVAAGITVNGLAILNEDVTLDSYYSGSVIGGPAAFVVVADDFDDFAQAIRKKLLIEIGGALVADARRHPPLQLAGWD